MSQSKRLVGVWKPGSFIEPERGNEELKAKQMNKEGKAVKNSRERRERQ